MVQLWAVLETSFQSPSINLHTINQSHIGSSTMYESWCWSSVRCIHPYTDPGSRYIARGVPDDVRRLINSMYINRQIIRGFDGNPSRNRFADWFSEIEAQIKAVLDCIFGLESKGNIAWTDYWSTTAIREFSGCDDGWYHVLIDAVVLWFGVHAQGDHLRKACGELQTTSYKATSVSSWTCSNRGPRRRLWVCCPTNKERIFYRSGLAFRIISIYHWIHHLDLYSMKSWSGTIKIWQRISLQSLDWS